MNECAQLIATVHDVSLLDCQTLFRKEQIWFTHKDKETAHLYSLAEFTTDKYFYNTNNQVALGIDINEPDFIF